MKQVSVIVSLIILSAAAQAAQQKIEKQKVDKQANQKNSYEIKDAVIKICPVSQARVEGQGCMDKIILNKTSYPFDLDDAAPIVVENQLNALLNSYRARGIRKSPKLDVIGYSTIMSLPLEGRLQRTEVFHIQDIQNIPKALPKKGISKHKK